MPAKHTIFLSTRGTIAHTTLFQEVCSSLIHFEKNSHFEKLCRDGPQVSSNLVVEFGTVNTVETEKWLQNHF